MGMEPGGPADKLGNEFERLWTVKQLLLVLDGDNESVSPERLGPDEKGVDLWIRRPDGTREGHQCKRGNGTRGSWTIRALHSAGILCNAQYQLERSEQHRFVIVSSDSAPMLEDLIERTTHCNDDPEAYVEYTLTSKNHREAFRLFCECLKLNPDDDDNRNKAYDLLRRMMYVRFDRPGICLRDLERLARLYVSGNPKDVVSCLGQLAIKIGSEWSSLQIRNHLREYDHSPKDLIDDPNAAAAIERLQGRFVKTFGVLLLEGQLIERDEAKITFERLIHDNDSRIVMLHGDAGNGKTGVVFDLVQRLKKESIPFLPLRLDRHILKNDPEYFGKHACGLPSSPVHCLKAFAGGQRAVLILDQLDAVRWTSMHSPDAMEVFEEVVEEALALPNIRVLVICRTFDMNDHPRIQAWKSEKQVVDIPVGELTDEQVQCVIGDHYARLDFRQRSLLRILQNLYLWSRLSQAGKPPIEFQTAADLMQSFWGYIREIAIESANISITDFDEFCQAIVKYMDSESRLTCPISHLYRWSTILEKMQSFNVLKATENNCVIWSHQSYFDFLLAEQLLKEIMESNQTVVAWLKTNDQSLFRREQLKLLLSLLRDVDHDTYISSIDDIITDVEIRFHLKHLVMSFLGSMPSAALCEVTLVMNYLTDHEWCDHFISHVLWGNANWFAETDDQGLIDEWLNSNNKTLVETTLRLMSSVHRDAGDRIASHLENYENEPSPWPGRLANCLAYCFAHEDSKRLFELRLRLVEREVLVEDFIDWKNLAKQHPHRVMLFLALHTQMLVKVCKEISQEDYDRKLPILDLHFKSHAEDILGAIKSEPSYAWEIATKSVDRIRRSMRLANLQQKRFADYKSPRFEVRKRCREWLTFFGRILAAAGRILIKQDIERFKLAADFLPLNRSKTAQCALIAVWTSSDPSAADDAVSWLCDNTHRFCLGSRRSASRYEPARRLLQRHSPHCTESVYLRLEKTILDFHDEVAWSSYKWQLRNKSFSSYYPWKNDIGLAQFVLLSALPEARLSLAARSKLDEGWRKFGHLPTGKRLRTNAGFDGCSIPNDRLHLICDRQWLEIMTGNWPDRSGRWRRVEGGLREASHEQFARSVCTSTERDPQRFARLALRIPSTADSRYLAQILHGLSRDKPPDGLDSIELEAWQGATDEQLEALLIHNGYTENIERAQYFCWLVKSRAKRTWSKAVRELLIRYATKHPDPASSDVASCELTERHADQEDVSVYSVDAINCVRGMAASAIGDLLSEHPELISEFETPIRELVNDNSPVIRVASVDACLPLLNIDRDKAVDLILSAVNCPDDRILDTHQVNDFLSIVMKSHLESIMTLIIRMINSDNEKVAQTGAEFVTAAWLFDGKLKSHMDECAKGKLALRKGVATVAAENITDKTVERGVLELVEMFLDDDDKAVRGIAVWPLRLEGILERPEGIRLAKRLTESKSFAESLHHFLYALDSFTGRLSDYAEVLFAACERLQQDIERAKESGEFLSVSTYKLPTVMLRLYQQTVAIDRRELHVKCLDMWDMMLSSRVGGVESELKKI